MNYMKLNINRLLDDPTLSVWDKIGSMYEFR